jgi:hypothetical protein
MSKKFLVAFGLILASVACSGNTAAPASRATPHVPFVHTPPVHPNSPLVGTYTTTITKRDGIFLVDFPAVSVQGDMGSLPIGNWMVEFRSDGYYTALGENSYSPAQYAGLGQYTVSGNHLTVSDVKCEEFDGHEGATATYAWELRGQVLTLKVVGADLCPTRELLFTSHPLHKQEGIG